MEPTLLILDEVRTLNLPSALMNLKQTQVWLSFMLTPAADSLVLLQPTNHLDLEACVWLEETLKNFKRILLLVSHSQDFMVGCRCLRARCRDQHSGALLLRRCQQLMLTSSSQTATTAAAD